MGKGIGSGKYWKCNCCGAFVTDIDWGEWVRGNQYHKTPTGGECRATNAELVNSLPEGATVVASLPTLPPLKVKPATVHDVPGPPDYNG